MNNTNKITTKAADLKARFYVATRNMNATKMKARNIAAQLQAEMELVAIFDQMRAA